MNYCLALGHMGFACQGNRVRITPMKNLFLASLVASKNFRYVSAVHGQQPLPSRCKQFLVGKQDRTNSHCEVYF